jgi:hypothetical protein
MHVAMLLFDVVPVEVYMIPALHVLIGVSNIPVMQLDEFINDRVGAAYR